jgi:hypothetical protein
MEQYVVLDIPLKDESMRPEIEKMLSKNFAALIDYWTVCACCSRCEPEEREEIYHRCPHK